MKDKQACCGYIREAVKHSSVTPQGVKLKEDIGKSALMQYSHIIKNLLP